MLAPRASDVAVIQLPRSIEGKRGGGGHPEGRDRIAINLPDEVTDGSKVQPITVNRR